MDLRTRLCRLEDPPVMSFIHLTLERTEETLMARDKLPVVDAATEPMNAISAQFSLSSQYRHRQKVAPLAERNRRLRVARLLLIATLAFVYSDIMLFRWMGLPITLAHAVFVASALATFSTCRRVDPKCAVLVFCLIALELTHALLSGFATESTWLTAFVQLCVCLGGFVMITGLRLDRSDLLALAPWIYKLGVVTGGLGIFQFVLLKLGMPVVLPEAILVRAYHPEMSSRTGGFLPAHLFAREPSYYAIGLLGLLMLVFFLGATGSSEIHLKLHKLALMCIFGGLLVSMSLTGVVGGLLLLLASFRNGRSRHIALSVATATVVLLTAATIEMWEPIQNRVVKAVGGEDSSAVTRLISATSLLLSAGGDIEYNLLGTGVGMDERGHSAFYEVYDRTRLRGGYTEDVKIHNILASVRFRHGWVGLTLYLMLLWAVTLPVSGGAKGRALLILFLVAFQFASGLYIYPGTWACYGVMFMFRRARLPAMLRHECASPPR